ncbi:MAG: hypothetical protein IJX22_01840 [Opitutales bacterium]|nr:hypothetical protein [Opitutales bacterium]
MAITHTYSDGRTVEFVTDTAMRMHVLDFEGKGANDDIVCQWCKHAFAFSKSPKCWRCGKYPDGKPDEVDESAPCEKFEDNGFGKAFSRNVLAETLPKDPQIRKTLVEQLRKEFGHAVAVVGDQIFHLGRMGVYAANIYKWWIRPIESGNLGNHVLDEIANASPSIRDAWNCETNPKVLEIDRDKIGLEEFKLMPFICYAPSQVKQRANGVALGKKIGNRTHWALLTNGKTHVDAEYIGSAINE